ncbi:MAG: AEC family transporter [Lachnospirales bacterium]
MEETVPSSASRFSRSSAIFGAPNLCSKFCATSTLTYVGSLITPLSLVYIGIVLAKAGLKTITFDKDTIVTLVGRFILAPLIMLLVLKFFAPNMATVEFKTFMIQSATPALAVLPILANQGKGDVEFSTNVVTLSTVLFVIVIPIYRHY